MGDRDRGVRKARWPSAHRRRCVHSTVSFAFPSAIVYHCLLLSTEVAPIVLQTVPFLTIASISREY